MSQIDQAFIQAYAPEQAYDTPPVGGVLPMAAEPIPAPHFRMPTNVAIGTAAYADTAVMQRELLVVGSEVPGSGTPSGERRPLSTFADPGHVASEREASFQPMFEVDAFRWPESVCSLLQSHQSLLNPVVEQLVTAGEAGRSMVGIAGLRPGVGCSTVLMCLARLLAETGKSVAMVDGNFASCALAKSLGIEFEIGWEDVLSGRVPLAESVVNSIDDQISLLPLSGSHPVPSELLAGIQTSVSAGVLRYHYDLVLFDLGSPGQDPQLAAARNLFEHCRIDASILVADTSATDARSGQQVDPMMSLLGSTCLGLIGNRRKEAVA
ncbi:MAG: CpsD/CapB family tyrosine-protein kinase [Planctomycetes bacterium]|nr:CpsD/CapB family tyrosine-protein kinase [Planctomycetota bacterium]